MQSAGPARLQALFRRAEDPEIFLLAQHLCRRWIGIRHRREPYPKTGLLQLAIDAQMIAAEDAGS